MGDEGNGQLPKIINLEEERKKKRTIFGGRRAGATTGGDWRKKNSLKGREPQQKFNVWVILQFLLFVGIFGWWLKQCHL